MHRRRVPSAHHLAASLVLALALPLAVASQAGAHCCHERAVPEAERWRDDRQGNSGPGLEDSDPGRFDRRFGATPGNPTGSRGGNGFGSMQGGGLGSYGSGSRYGAPPGSGPGGMGGLRGGMFGAPPRLR